MKTRTTYIDLINQFWTQSKECAFNPSDAVLYFFLLNTCNALHWKQPFGQSDRFLSLSLGFSINTIRGAKNRLKQRGLIDFKAPEKNGKGIEGQTKYVILSVSNFDIVPDTDADTDADTVPDRDTDNNIRQDKIREDKKEKIKKENLDFSSLWQEWENYMKEVHSFRHNDYSRQKSQEKLKELGKNDLAAMQKIVNNSIGNNYKDFYRKETKQEEKKEMGRVARDGTRIMMF